MVHYRRNLVAGGTYFFTITLQDRRSSFLIDHIDALRSALRQIRGDRPFVIDAIVVLPEHFHMMRTLPSHDADYSGRMCAIKSRFTQSLVRRDAAIRRNEKGEYNLWQRRFWEHTIRGDDDYQRHVDYIHYNPVKHGYVEKVCDWQYSSFHRYVRKGFLPIEWAGESAAFEKNAFGE